MTLIKRDLKQGWNDVEIHKQTFGHLPDESCKSKHPLECNRPEGTESPYVCLKCGKPANSPAYKRYCWNCYDKYTDGKVFD